MTRPWHLALPKCEGQKIKLDPRKGIKMSENKEFIILDNELDLAGDGFDSKADAIQAAREKIGEGGRYAPYAIFEKVALVKKANQPAMVIDL